MQTKNFDTEKHMRIPASDPRHTSMETYKTQPPYDGSVRTYDNFLQKESLQEILNIFNNDAVWSFTGTSNESSELDTRFWAAQNLENLDLFKDLWGSVQMNCGLNNYELTRCYANGQTGGMSGSPHTDDGDLTALFYPSDWKHFLGGHLYFVKDNHIAHMVEYIQNRLVLFPANLEHYSGAPISIYPDIRVSVAFKLKKVPDW